MLTDRVVHWQWLARKRRAQVANIIGRPFTYRHPLLGRFVYHPLDDLSRHVLLYDFERPELHFAIQRARQGGTILDIGANIGVFTAACARAAGSQGGVIALEPSPVTFEKLRLTCDRLRLKNVRLLPVAAAGTNGRARFVAHTIHELRQHLVDGREGSPADTIAVETRRLDDLCAEEADAVSLVKLDIEGHEPDALAGAERILHNGRAHLIVEVNPAALAANGASPEALRTLLSQTHRCTAVVRQNGTVSDGDSHFAVRPPDEMLNTLWEPR